MSQYALRLPNSLMEAARRVSKEENASMNQFFVTAIAEKLSALETEKLLYSRAKRADVDHFLQAMDRVPDIPPEHSGDMID
jgi:hypothetical protein